MASEIRVNRLSNRSGLSTITFANGGVQFSGITTFANGDFRVGTGATILNPTANEMQFHTAGSTRLTINNSGANLGTGSLTAVDATFTGNVSIGKTLTYEDVKNVDSVGVVTARTGVKITGGDFTVGTAITASSVTGNVTNDVGITSFTGPSVWFKGLSANKDMYWSHASGSLVFKDTARILVGDGSDLQIHHTSGNSFIENSTGTFKLRGATVEISNPSAAQMLQCNSGGAVNLYHNGSKKFETTADGIEVTGKIFPSSHIDMADNVKLLIGTGDDLQVFHDGSNSYIQDSGTGNLILQATDFQVKGYNTGEVSIAAAENGAVDLYHNNSKKLETTGTGVKISCDTNADGIQLYSSGSTYNEISSNANRSAENMSCLYLLAKWNNTNIAAIDFVAGPDTTNKDDGHIRFQTAAGGTVSEKVRITHNGMISTGGLTAPTSDMHVWRSNAGGDVSLRVQNDTGTDSGTTASIYLTTSPTDNFNTCYIKASRATGDTTIGYGTQTASLTLLAEGDVMVNRTLYGGNGGRRNWFDNGAMNVIQRYQNCHAAGNYHSYGWAIDRFQNRGGNSQWGRSTNVPSGKGFDYSLKVGSGTGGSICQGIELTNQGKPGPFRVGTFWCVSVWSTQPVNQASNNGFCQDLGSTNYIGLTARGPSGAPYSESGESVSGTASGTYKRYYKVWEVTSAPHSNNHTLNFGWAINYSGSGTSEWTGFQVEQVANADCKPSSYEHVDYPTDLRRVQRYAYRSTACRYINGYKRHDNNIHFEIQSPVPMTSYTTSNGGGSAIGAAAWDYGMLTNFQGNLQNPAATAIVVSEYDHSSGTYLMVLTTGYTGCTHCWIPSWESAQFEVACGPF